MHDHPSPNAVRSQKACTCRVSTLAVDPLLMIAQSLLHSSQSDLLLTGAPSCRQLLLPSLGICVAYGCSEAAVQFAGGHSLVSNRVLPSWLGSRGKQVWVPPDDYCNCTAVTMLS